MGEKVNNLRVLIKRFTLYTNVDGTAAGSSFTVDPLYFDGSTTPNGGMPFTHYIAPLFKYWSGSQRLKALIVIITGTNPQPIPNDHQTQIFLGPMVSGGSPAPPSLITTFPPYPNSYIHIIRDSVSVFRQVQIPFYSPVPYRPMCDVGYDADQRKLVYFRSFTNAFSPGADGDAISLFHAAGDDFNYYYLCGPPALVLL